MNTPTMDSKGSNHRPQPLDGSPGLARPHRLALLIALALGSLSMLIAIPGTASAQTVQRISNCLAVTTNEGNKTFTNNCGYVLSVKGTREATGSGCQPLTTTSLGKDNNNNTLTYASYGTVNGRICFSYPNQRERYLSGGDKRCDDVSSPDLSACPLSGGLAEISPPRLNSGHIKIDNDNGSTSKTSSLTEGENDTFDIKLSAAPESNVVINITSATPASVTVSPSSLTFTTGNWQTDQTLTITAAADTNSDDESVAVTLAPDVSSGLYVGNRTITVNTTDLNQSIITNPVSGGVLSEENSTGSNICVELEAEPSAEVTVSAVASGGVTITPPSLSFPVSDYDDCKNFTIKPVDDPDGTDTSGTVTFTANGADDKALTYSVEDDDGAITVSSGAVTATEEGTTGTFTVTLTAPPDSSKNAVLSVTSSATSKATVSPASLTFSSSDYTTAQTVTVTGVSDTDGTDDTATITLAATSDSGYSVPNVTKSITVEDDDGAIVLSSADVNAIEGGADGTFSVTLAAAPASSTELTITNEDTGSATVSPATLTFSAGNYSTAQMVTVEGDDDNDGTDDSATIKLAVSSAGGYRAKEVSKTVKVFDDDGSIKINADEAYTTPVDVAEEGQATFNVTLGAPPESEVTVSLASADVLVATVDPVSLRFDDSNYSTAKPVTVRGSRDRDYDDETVKIRLTVSDLNEYRINNDGDYSDDNDVTEKTIEVDDDDDPPVGQIVIRKPADAILEGGGGSVWGISLVSDKPIRDPIIFDSTVSLAVSGTDSGAVTVSPATLTFVAMSPSKEQLVTITPVDDNDYEDESATIEISVDGGVDADAQNIPITVIDDDSPPAGTIVLDDTGLMTLDEGSSGTFTVKLDGTVPTYPVTVSLASSDTGAVKVSPPTMTFISSNSKREQTATVTAVNDSNYDDESVSINLTSTGGLTTPSVTKLVEVRDDDIEPKLIISEERLSLGENQSTTINVRLNQETPIPVNVSITTSSSDIGVDPSSFSFEPSKWNTPRPIAVYVFADSNRRDDFGIITFTATTGKIGSVFENLVQELPIEMTEVTVPGRPSPTLSIKSYALAIPPPSAQDQANVRIWCRHSEPCTVSLECSAQEDGMFMEGELPQPIPSMGTVTLTATEIADIIEGSWEGKGRLGCALLSDGDLLAQVWTRSGDGVLINNSATLRSVDNRVDIHDIPSPDSSDVSNIRIRCPTEYPGDCQNVNLKCHNNEGMPYTGVLGTIKRGAVFHMQTADLSEIIVHKWQGSELYCQVSASRPFTVQVLTRTGGGGALVNNSASGSGLM